MRVGSNKSSTLVATLFTFCPPGPEDRAKRNLNDVRGIPTVRVILISPGGLFLSVDLRTMGESLLPHPDDHQSVEPLFHHRRPGKKSWISVDRARPSDNVPLQTPDLIGLVPRPGAGRAFCPRDSSPPRHRQQRYTAQEAEAGLDAAPPKPLKQVSYQGVSPLTSAQLRQGPLMRPMIPLAEACTQNFHRDTVLVFHRPA